MSHHPQWKVFSPSGDYVGSLVHGEDAAALVAIQGEGATIRFAGHSKKHVVWTEGSEEQSAGESYDETARIMADRLDVRRAEGDARREVRCAAYVKARGL